MSRIIYHNKQMDAYFYYQDSLLLITMFFIPFISLTNTYLLMPMLLSMARCSVKALSIARTLGTPRLEKS